MQRIRLKILLPLSQLILAVVLLTVGQHLDSLIKDKYEPPPLPMPTRVCFALNAPALLASWPIVWASVALHIRKATSAILSPIDEIPFLIMVTILWYVIARRIEGITRKKKGAYASMSAARIIENVLFLFIGVILLYGVITQILYLFSYPHSTIDLVLSMLFLLWAMLLFYFPARDLYHALRRQRTIGR